MANYHKPIFRSKILFYLSTIGFTLTIGFIACGFIGLFLTSALLLALAFFSVSAMAFTILVACLHDSRYFLKIKNELVKEYGEHDVFALSKRTYVVMPAALLVSLYSTYVGLSLIINLSFLPVMPISVITLSIMAVSALVIFVFGLYRASFKKCNVCLTKNDSDYKLVAVMDSKISQLKNIANFQKGSIDSDYPILGKYFDKLIEENTSQKAENYKVALSTTEDEGLFDVLNITNKDFVFKNK